jgi:parallel beta-helix repeat protein
MNRQTRRSNPGLARGLKRSRVLEFERMEGRLLLSVTYMVNNTNSSGAGSLFDAITQLDMDVTTPSDPNIIQFDIPSGGAQTIALTQQLPDITQPTDVQGYTQPGSSANTNPLTMGDNAVLTVVVSGGGNIDNGLIFDASAAGSSVEGLDLVGFAGNAITINANNVSVSGNFIGVGPDGTSTAATSNLNGVLVSGTSGGTIGGTAVGAGNVISGNTKYGVRTEDSTGLMAADDIIQGNGSAGVLLTASPGASITSSTIGGTVTDLGNGGDGIIATGSTGLAVTGDLIDGNVGSGIDLESGSDLATITSSTIGGTESPTPGGLPNGGYGILVSGSTGDTIGGTQVEDTIDGNTIDGNTAGGILFEGSADGEIDDSQVENNGGVGVAFMTTIASSIIDDLIAANAGGGVLLEDSPYASVISLPRGQTVIENNGGFGVSVVGSSGATLGGFSSDANLLVTSNHGPGIAISVTTGAILGSIMVTDNAADGIDVDDSTGMKLTVGDVSSNHGEGISLTAGSAATILLSTVEQNGSFGIGAIEGAGVIISSSTISGNSGIGVSLVDPSISPSVTNTLIQSNVGGGILLDESTGGTITSSTIGGTTPALGNGDFGVSISDSSGVTIGNTGDFSTLIANNAGFGISTVGSPMLTLQGLNVDANERPGISLESSPSATIESNFVESNHGDGIDLVGSTGVTFHGNIVAENSGVGISLSLNSGATINGLADMANGSTGLGVDDSAIQLLFATISGNASTGVSIDSPPNTIDAGSKVVLSGDTIQSNQGGGILLAGDLSGGVISLTTIGGTTADLGNGGFGLLLEGSYGVIIGDPSPTSHVLIQHNGGNGISLIGSGNGRIMGSNYIADNTGDGIVILSSDGVSVQGVTVLSNGGSGINVPNGSNGTSITASMIYANAGFGVTAFNSLGVTLGGPSGSGLIIIGNRGSGISASLVTALAIEGDTIQANRGGGIVLDAVTGGVASSMIGGVTPDLGNDLVGVSVTSSPELGLANLFVLSNAGDGIVLASASNGSLIEGGQVSGNAGDGVVISASPFVTIGSTTSVFQVTGNLTDGIDIINSSDGVAILGTEVGWNERVGINVVNSVGVAVGTSLGVLVHDNGGDGIDLSGSLFSTVMNATSMNNAGAGLNITSPGVSVSASNFLTNAGSGIEVSGATSNFTTSLGLYDAGNKGVGVLLLDSSANTIGGAGQSIIIGFNGGNGVEIIGIDSKFNLVQLSTIHNNGANGVEIEGGASTNVVQSDIISGNLQSGVAIDSLATNNYLLSDLIGTDLSGTNAANGVSGISITNASLNFIESTKLIDNPYGIYLENAPGKQILGNSVANSPGYTTPGQIQTGIYLYNTLTQLNEVANNIVTDMNGYGILFLNTPQDAAQANVQVNNTVTGSMIANILTNATATNLPSLNPPVPILVPTITTTSGSSTSSTPPTVSASSVKVQVSSAFSGPRPISPKISHLAKSLKISN